MSYKMATITKKDGKEIELLEKENLMPVLVFDGSIKNGELFNTTEDLQKFRMLFVYCYGINNIIAIPQLTSNNFAISGVGYSYGVNNYYIVSGLIAKSKDKVYMLDAYKCIQVTNNIGTDISKTAPITKIWGIL